MMLALLLLAALPDWVPAHWSSNDPKSLDLLAGSGINCVLVESSKLNPPFVKRAAARDVAVVSVLRPQTGTGEDALRSRQLGVNAIAIEGDFDPALRASIRDQAAGLPVIELPSRQAIRLDSHDAIAGTWQGLWPGIVIEHGGTTMSGPTSNPWVNTNTGLLRFLRAAMNSVIWLCATPPANTVIPVERYAIAIADAQAGGARWIITLDDDLNRRLLAGEAKARADWKRIGEYVQYYEQHREWREYRPFSRMALMQDKDSGGLLSASLLDLMYAQHIATRAIPAPRLNDQSLTGIRTVINVAPPEAFSDSQRQALARFAQSGGVVLNPPADWRFGEDSPGSQSPNKKQLDRIQDIWEMLYNATARRNFGARTFNTAGILFNVLTSSDDRRLLIHLVNYTQFPADSITVQALGSWKQANLYQPGVAVRQLSVYPVKDGTGIDLDKLDVLASLVVE